MSKPPSGKVCRYSSMLLCYKFSKYQIPYRTVAFWKETKVTAEQFEALFREDYLQQWSLFTDKSRKTALIQKDSDKKIPAN